MNSEIFKKSLYKGIFAFFILLTVYFLILTLVSGWKYAWEQFIQYWYYIVSLALGFGIQFSLYTYLKGVIKKQAATGKVLATTGATSTAAMISCCTHYLTNILPILGVTGIITFITQYQVQFFWVGLIFNILGIIYIGNKIIKITGIKINKQSFFTNKAVVFYLCLLAIALLSILLNNVSINVRPKRINSTANTANTNQTTNSLETIESNEGPVAVTVTPDNLGKDSSLWNFNIALDTHSEELSEDLVVVSELLDDQGKSYKPISWEGAPPGGHHREGILNFNPISPKPQSLELRIKNVGGVLERSFKWSL